MADVRPFRGLRFDPARAGDLGALLCPPFGALDPLREPAYRRHHPFNAVHLEVPPHGADPAPSLSRPPAGAAVHRWRAEGVLRLEDRACFYVHELRFHHDGRTRMRRELIAAVGLEPWECRVILPHERTFARVAVERAHQLRTAGAHVSPILAVFEREAAASAGDAIALAWAWAATRPPAAAGRDLEGHDHRLWLIDDTYLLAAIERYFRQRQLVIADGHHRYEAALLHREAVARTLRPHALTGAEQFVLMHLVATDDPGLVVLPTHRTVRGVGARFHGGLFARPDEHVAVSVVQVPAGTPDALLAAARTALEARAGLHPSVAVVVGPVARAVTIVTARQSSDQVPGTVRGRPGGAAWSGAALADQAIIGPLVSAHAATAGAAVSYIHNARAAISQVLDGSAQLAVLVSPTDVGEVVNVARSGERLPEKSTCFYPKPPVGLVLHPLDQPPSGWRAGPACTALTSTRDVGA